MAGDQLYINWTRFPCPPAALQVLDIRSWNGMTGIRLGIMMFLQFFIWGSWFVTVGSFLAANLGASGSQSALAFSTQSWGAIIAPFIIRLIADRYFNAERLLGIIRLIGAALMYVLSRARSFGTFYPCLLGYMILYMPTLALVNAISFRQMEDPSRHFSRIRVWGTIGWIVAGLVISYVFFWDSAAALKAGLLRNTFLMCAGASLLLGLYSFTLPATPPRVKPGEHVRVRDLLGLDALALLRDRNFLVFFLASILICIPLAFYYQYANQFLTEIQVANATGEQTLGQMSEVLFMLLIPFFLLRLGMKATLLLGMLAGFWTAGQVADRFTGPAGHDWRAIWLIPAAFALVVFALFALVFRNEKAAFRPTG